MKKHLNRIWLGAKTILQMILIGFAIIAVVFIAEIGLGFAMAVVHLYPRPFFTTLGLLATVLVSYVAGWLREEWATLDGDDE